MTFQKTAQLLAIASLVASLGASSVHADSYGNGGETPKNDITINKEVKNPVTNIYVENLGSADPTFSPNGEVTFRFTIKNSSGETFNPVELTDQLPEFLVYWSSSVPATYDAGLRKVTMKLENMIAGETRTVEMVAKVADTGAFKSTRTIFCESNYAKVTAPSRPAGDDDTADFCIQTKVAGVENLPVAGFNDLFTLIPFLSLGGIGATMLLQKKA
jgi:uncharacterized repeat protein (TIGR01451 family)